MGLYRVAVMAITGNTNWDFDSLQMPGFRFGQNFQKFGMGWQGTSVDIVKGQDVIKLAAQHDTVVCQHWPSADFIIRLKQAGVRRVFLWADVEAMPATQYWSTRQQTVWEVMKMWRLVGTRHNRFGHQMVDPYEMSDNGPTGKPHCWMIDIAGNRYCEAFLETVGRVWEREGYRGGVVDGIWFDNVMNRPYYGTATNAPIITADWEKRYVYGWKTILSTARKIGFGEIYGNTDATIDVYPELDGKWSELFFYGPPNQYWGGKIAGSMEKAEAAGNRDQHLILNVEGPGTDRYALNEEKTWSNTIATAAEKYAGRVGCVTARTSKWLMSPPGTESEAKTSGGASLGEPAPD